MEPKMMSTKPSCCFVLEPNESDVLLGRGNNVNHRPGNIQFRSFAAERAPEYLETNSKEEKNKLALDLVSKVAEKGGRFLRSVTLSDPDGELTAAWEIVGDEVVMVKVKQAMRDAASAKKEKRAKVAMLCKKQEIDWEVPITYGIRDAGGVNQKRENSMTHHQQTYGSSRISYGEHLPATSALRSDPKQQPSWRQEYPCRSSLGPAYAQGGDYGPPQQSHVAVGSVFLPQRHQESLARFQQAALLSQIGNNGLGSLLGQQQLSNAAIGFPHLRAMSNGRNAPAIPSHFYGDGFPSRSTNQKRPAVDSDDGSGHANGKRRLTASPGEQGRRPTEINCTTAGLSLTGQSGANGEPLRDEMEPTMSRTSEPGDHSSGDKTA